MHSKFARILQIVGCPFSGGQVSLPYPSANDTRLTTSQPKPGVDQGPIHLINAGLTTQLRELGWSVLFDGHHQFDAINTLTDPPIGVLKNPRLVSKVSQAVAEAVGSHAKKGHLPVTIGGDHSLVRSLLTSLVGRKEERMYAEARVLE